MSKLTKAAIDQYRVQLARGQVLTIEQQRALVAHVDHEEQQAVDNLNRLVTAREIYDRLCHVQDDGNRISKTFLGMLVDLGVTLGHGKAA